MYIATCYDIPKNERVTVAIADIHLDNSKV